MKILIFIIGLLICTCVVEAQYSHYFNIREISVDGLNDYAIASYDNFGPVIYYNPTSVQYFGALTYEFVRQHEIGHHQLGHIVNRIFNSSNRYVQDWLNRNMESQADEYAVMYFINQGRRDIIQAGYKFFWDLNNAGDYTHMPSRQRANRIGDYFYKRTGISLF